MQPVSLQRAPSEYHTHIFIHVAKIILAWCPTLSGKKIISKRLKDNKAIKKFIASEVGGCYINHDTTIRHLSKTSLEIYLKTYKHLSKCFKTKVPNCTLLSLPDIVLFLF